MQNYLQATDYFDFNDAQVRTFSDQFVEDDMDELQKAISLYYAVRDSFKYNPYTFSIEPQSFKASHCVRQGQSYCVPKAVLLVALARLNGIPARLGLADVKNHLSSPALLEFLQSDEFVMHGYVEMYLRERWVKSTPAFDKRLCERMGVQPLEFNGRDDSIFHEFDSQGQKAMEYLREHGQFDDLPYELILTGIRAAYPHLETIYLDKLEQQGRSLEGDLGDGLNIPAELLK